MAVAMILVVLGIVPLVCLQIAGLTTATAITVGLFLVGSIIERRRLEAVNAELNSWPELYISVRKGR
jgi:hypothetical protein